MPHRIDLISIKLTHRIAVAEAAGNRKLADRLKRREEIVRRLMERVGKEARESK